MRHAHTSTASSGRTARRRRSRPAGGAGSHGPPRQRRRDRPLSVAEHQVLHAHDPPASPSSPVTASAPRSSPRAARARGGVRRRVKVETTEYDLGARRWHATGETLPDSRARRAARPRRDPARRRRRPDACPAACSSGGCCCGCASSSTTTSTCGRRGSTRASPRRWPVEAGRHRLRRGAGGHRGPVRRQRRRRPARHPARDRDRGQRQHGVRRRAGRPGRLRAGPAAAPQAPDAGAQDQRAGATPATSGRGPSTRWRRTSRTSRPTTCTSTRPRSSWSPSPSASTSSSPTTCSATSSPTWPRRSPAASASPPAATSTSAGTNPSMFEPVHGSAPGHRRARAWPTRPRRSCPSALLLEHLGLAEAAARVEAAVAADLAARGAGAPRSTREVGDAVCARESRATADAGRYRRRHDRLLTIELAPSDLAAHRRGARRLLQDPGFGQVFTDHMVSARYSDGDGAGTTPACRRTRRSTLDPATSALHYGQAIFEGLKAYHQPDGSVALFRPDQNARRFQRSARRLAMAELPERAVPRRRSARWSQADRDWVPTRPGESLYLRPLDVRHRPVPRGAAVA